MVYRVQIKNILTRVSSDSELFVQLGPRLIGMDHPEDPQIRRSYLRETIVQYWISPVFIELNF